jgi:gamma-glutamylcyclotransferase (GGCT)/AIG2-like uncharacterized protein YtfP
LVNSVSRKLTGQTGAAIPAVVHGLVRHWSLIDDSYRLSPLAANVGEGQVNGVLLKVDEHTLSEFDYRETGYRRIKLDHKNIDALSPFDDQEPVWVYVTENIFNPTVSSPIVQSYVDTVIAGCLEISEAFAKQFIEHTVGWHHPMENDRHQPKYARVAGVQKEHHAIIDQLLTHSGAYSA